MAAVRSKEATARSGVPPSASMSIRYGSITWRRPLPSWASGSSALWPLLKSCSRRWISALRSESLGSLSYSARAAGFQLEGARSRFGAEDGDGFGDAPDPPSAGVAAASAELASVDGVFGSRDLAISFGCLTNLPSLSRAGSAPLTG